MDEKMYVSDMIGEQYKEWEPGKFYFLTAGTGTGKSTFIINQLLDYAIQLNRRVLYLVNRTLLRDQLQQEINKLSIYDPRVSYIIDIKTYQECEKQIRKRCNDSLKYGKPDMIWYSMVKQNIDFEVGPTFPLECGRFCWLGDLNYYSYIICDEAHYFSHDSIFNTNTSIIYKAILGRTFAINADGFLPSPAYPHFRAVCVFMSATLGDLKNFVIRDIRKIYYNVDNSIYIGKTYLMPTDYSYVNIHLINSVDEIPRTVIEEKGKWFIFINDKDKGRKIVDAVNQIFGVPNTEHDEDKATNSEGQKRKAVFIDADFFDEEEERKEKDRIKYEKCFECDVLVSTSVLDNGISIKDKETRKIIILAEMEDDFIQMLGRKRVNKDEEVDLYICPRSVSEFYIRLNKFIRPHVDCYNQIFKSDQMEIMDKLLNPKWQQYLCHFISSCAKSYFINDFALSRFFYMKESYEEIIKELKENRYAFLKRQFKWLGKSEEEMEKCLSEYEAKTLPKLIEGLEKRILDFVDKPLSEEDRKKLRTALYGKRGDFHELYDIKNNFRKKLKNDNAWDQIAKTTVAITESFFNELCIAYDLPFVMEDYQDVDSATKDDKSKKYIIRKKDK